MNLADIDLGLPPQTSVLAPDFTDAPACQEWLANLPLTNVAQALAQLLRQINLLNRYPLSPDARLQILELLRGPIDCVQEQGIRHFSGRPLPLSESGQAAFDTSQTLWQEQETGYLHCLQSSFSGGTGFSESAHLQTAMAATRALSSMLAMYLDHCRASILPSPMYWRQLHLIYHAAEELRISRLPVKDGLRQPRNSGEAAAVSAATVYTEILLVAAAYPMELQTRQLALVANWAQRWSGKVEILQQPPENQRTPALCVDLAGTQAAAFQFQLTEYSTLRWLELSGLRSSIKKRLVLLQQGQSPASLNLGKDCIQPACGALLKLVYRYWCKGGRKQDGGSGRAILRAGGDYQLVAGMDAIHYYLCGQVFRKADQPNSMSRREHEEIATFGRIATRFDEEKKAQHDFMLEKWRVLDESAAELHLERSLKHPGGRLCSSQLVAVRKEDCKGFLLGILRCVAMSSGQDSLLSCVHILPGTPVAVALRNTGANQAGMQFSQGIFLPAIESLGEVASVLTPAGWFSPGKIIGVEADEMDTSGKIRLDRLIERGKDFDRIAFSWS